MSEEKEFTFTRMRSPSEGETYTKKESELDQAEKDLLLGAFIHDFNKLPDQVKIMFMQRIYDQTKEKLSKEWYDVEGAANYKEFMGYLQKGNNE